LAQDSSSFYIVHVKLKIVFIALFLLVLTATSAWASAFKFVNVQPRQADEMRLALDVATLRLQKLLEIKLPDTITVVVVQTLEQFDSVAQGHLPEWGAAAAIPSRRLIILREPMMDRYPGNTVNLLQHELAHIALHLRMGGRPFPRFLDEGFASWFAGEWHFNNIVTIAAAQITKSLLPLREIDNVNAFQRGQADLAYSQSYLVVLFIFNRFGELGWLDLVDSLAAGRSLNEATRSAFNMSFWQFEADYRRFLSDNYTVFAILSNTMGLWIILALVVIAGYIMIKRRKKDAIDRWKEEEKLESTDFDYDGSDSPWD
jgi:hypothetical protein